MVESTKKKQVFVISPIGGEGSEVRKRADLFLKYIVRKALPESEYDVLRADEEDSPYAITESMLGRILKADLCVADLTGLNPNVMYELALAHAASKKVVVMTSDAGAPPFDIKDVRVVKYGLLVDEAEAAVKQLREKAEHVPPPGTFEKMLNPVATAFREWTERQQIDAVEGGPDKAIVALVEKLEEKVERIDARTSDSNRRKRDLQPVARAPQDVGFDEFFELLEAVKSYMGKAHDQETVRDAERLAMQGTTLMRYYNKHESIGRDDVPAWRQEARAFLSRADDVPPNFGFGESFSAKA